MAVSSSTIQREDGGAGTRARPSPGRRPGGGGGAPLAIALATLVAGCVTIDDDEGGGEPGDASDPVAIARQAPCDDDRCRGQHGDHRRVRIAWLASDPSNAYDAANLEGVREVAADHHSTVRPSYSYFDPALQLDQCLAAARSRHTDAIVIIPTDAVGILPCIAAARARGVPVVATDLPIGPDIATVEPQVPGQVGAVLVPAAAWADQLTPLVVDRCAAHAPCNVVYLAGSFDVAFDQVALAALDAAAQANPGMQIVAAEEAFYDRGLASALTEGILAAHPDVHVIVGAGDQMAQGAEDAIAAAGITAPIQIIGAGAGGYGIAAVRDGRWYATFMALPYTEGVLAAEIAIRAARCRTIPDPGINPVEDLGLPAFFTTDNQALFEGFEPQWPG